MATAYEYSTLRLQRGGLSRVREDVAGAWRDRVASLGGRVFGLWTGEIGFATDQAVLVTAWPDGAEPTDAGLPDGVLEWATERLAPTVRPADATPPTDPGVYAHRWFHTRDSDWDEFLELSQKGWIGFESLYDCRIVGLFLAKAETGTARALLLTRYASLSEWERSRPFRGEPPEGADSDLYASMRDAFGRRARLTEWSIVRTTRLA